MSVLIDIEKKLGDFSLKVNAEAGDEVLALLGASGCGKSMTLRCVAGIETPDRGRIIVDGITLFDSEKKISLSPQQRRTGLMFQNYALFPNMTVYQNIRTGTLRDKSLTDREEKIREIISRFGLSGLENHLPSQLSGGQAQRTALARILISDPRILLLDEPFSALDSHLRFQLEHEVREVIRSFGHSVLLVSHDRDEVYRTADRIAVMNSGRVEMTGDRETVFRSPSTCAAARLTGVTNITAAKMVPGENSAGVTENRPVSENRSTSGSRVLLPALGLELESAFSFDGADCAGFRATEIQPGPGENSFLAEVTEIIENPLTCTLLLKAKGGAAFRKRAESSSEGPDSGTAPGTISMELDKKQQIPDSGLKELEVHIPKSAVLPLKDGKADCSG